MMKELVRARDADLLVIKRQSALLEGEKREWEHKLEQVTNEARRYVLCLRWIPSVAIAFLLRFTEVR